MGIHIKTATEIEGMRVAGRLAAEVLEMIRGHVRPGVSTEELDHLSLTAVDGAFDGPVESVVGYIPPMWVIPGWHLLFIQGQDDAGHWGAVSAAFFEMPVDGILTEHSFVPLIAYP